MNLKSSDDQHGIKVLLFHGLCERIPEYAVFPGGRSRLLLFDEFLKIIQWCSENFRPLRLENIDDFFSFRNDGLPPIILTFDDGLASFFDLALPVLQDYQMPAVVFVTTDWTNAGRTPCIYLLERAVWNRLPVRLGITVNEKRISLNVDSRDEVPGVFATLWEFLFRNHFPPLELRPDHVLFDDQPWDWRMTPEDRHFWHPASWEELYAAASSGYIEIGSHMVSHTPLPWLSHEEKRFQLEHSRNVLSSITGLPVRACSYPHGITDNSTIVLSEQIYDWGFTIKPGHLFSETQRGAGPRYPVEGEEPAKLARILEHDSLPPIRDPQVGEEKWHTPATT